MSGYYVFKKKTAEGMQNKFMSTRTIVVGQAVRSMAVATIYSSGTGRAVHGCSYNI